MHIAIVDYKITPTNPIGSCHLRLIDGLRHNHRFTVFATEFANPDPDRIDFVRIPAPSRPLSLLFTFFHLMAPWYIAQYQRRHHLRFDIIQFVESNLTRGDVSYVQFCHRRYLRMHWPHTRPSGLRRISRYLDHKLHALLEPLALHRVRRVLAASKGLARELADEYPFTKGKITVIPNFVDLDAFLKPSSFDRDAFRSSLHIPADATLLAFAALGHFERKGLPLLLEALASIPDPKLHLLVVGGSPSLVHEYEHRSDQLHLANRTHYVGLQSNVRPFFWASDAFAFPSYYEVFPLVALQAAAAGLPIIAAPINGIEDLLVDEHNGYLVEHTVPSLVSALNRFHTADHATRAHLSTQARLSAEAYSIPLFLQRWQSFYESIPSTPPPISTMVPT